MIISNIETKNLGLKNNIFTNIAPLEFPRLTRGRLEHGNLYKFKSIALGRVLATLFLDKLFQRGWIVRHDSIYLQLMGKSPLLFIIQNPKINLQKYVKRKPHFSIHLS